MTEQAAGAVDLSAIETEVGQLSSDDVRAQLLKLRVRQKVQQAKHYNPDKMKEYQAKQRAKQKLLKERAIALGLWDSINAEAEKQAEAQIAETVPAGADEE